MFFVSLIIMLRRVDWKTHTYEMNSPGGAVVLKGLGGWLVELSVREEEVEKGGGGGGGTTKRKEGCMGVYDTYFFLVPQ